jgi:competence protein ComEA
LSETEQLRADPSPLWARQLDALPGIGRKRARMIIAHRPYKATDALVTRKIIPQSVYNQIRDKIVTR